MSKYEDMLYLKRPTSPRKKMNRIDRAAQFAPFAALSGHKEAMDETKRKTKEKIQLSTQQIDVLNTKLIYLQNAFPSTPILLLTYFEKDLKKEGGSYIQIECMIKKIDVLHKQIILDTHKIISFEDIIDIESHIFDEWNISNG